MDKINFNLPNIESIKKEGYNAVDMHFHSEYSLDAISKIENVLKNAKKQRIGVAITDHNEIKGNLIAKSTAKDVMIIPGIEVSCFEGTHCLFYFYEKKELKDFFKLEVKPWFDKNPFKIGYTTSQLIERSKDYNCLVCAPHPYSVGMTGMKNIDIDSKMLKRIEAIEVINGYNMHKWNLKAVDWAKKAKKGISAGTDGHTTHELGKAVTLTNEDTVEGFLDEIKKKKSFVIGKEDSILEKALLGLMKEEVYITKTHHEKEALKLLSSQFSTEVQYLKSKYKDQMSSFLGRFKKHH